MKIRLIGSGDRVDAIATLAEAAGTSVGASDAELFLVDADPDEMRAVIRELAPGPDARVVLLSRGLEPPLGRRLTEIVTEESACLRVGVLAGPIFASEVRRASPCAAVVASPFRDVQDAVSRALHSPLCRIYPSDDLPGVELAGALVEVVAAALGAARALGMGVGLQAMVVTRGIAEGARLCTRSGGHPETFSGLAGAGELVAGLALDEHPGHGRGAALARGEPDPALASLCAVLLTRCKDLPITYGVGKVASGELSAATAMSALLHREQRDERDGARPR